MIDLKKIIYNHVKAVIIGLGLPLILFIYLDYVNNMNVDDWVGSGFSSIFTIFLFLILMDYAEKKGGWKGFLKYYFSFIVVIIRSYLPR